MCVCACQWLPVVSQKSFRGQLIFRYINDQLLACGGRFLLVILNRNILLQKQPKIKEQNSLFITIFGPYYQIPSCNITYRVFFSLWVETDFNVNEVEVVISPLRWGFEVKSVYIYVCARIYFSSSLPLVLYCGVIK